MICPAKHTIPNDIPNTNWKCPKCGANSDFFVIEESAVDSAEECNLLHEEDELRCCKCEHATSGKKYTAWYRKNYNLVPCPHCKGKGVVPGELKECM